MSLWDKLKNWFKKSFKGSGGTVGGEGSYNIWWSVWIVDEVITQTGRQINNTGGGSGTNTPPAYYERLLELKNCLGYDEPYDVDTHSGGTQSAVHPNFAFCEAWEAYRMECAEDPMTEESYISWAQLYTTNMSVFNNIIGSTISLCLTTEMMEEYMCRRDALTAMTTTNGLSLSPIMETVVLENVPCGEGFEEGVSNYLIDYIINSSGINNSNLSLLVDLLNLDDKFGMTASEINTFKNEYNIEENLVPIVKRDWSNSDNKVRIAHIYYSLAIIYESSIKFNAPYNVEYSLDYLFTNVTGTASMDIVEDIDLSVLGPRAKVKGS